MMKEIEIGDEVATRTTLCRALLLGTVQDIYSDNGAARYVVKLWTFPNQPIDIERKQIEKVLEPPKTPTAKGNLGKHIAKLKASW